MASDRPPDSSSIRCVTLFFFATLIAAVLTITLVACAVAWLLGTPVTSALGIYSGVICGLIAFLFVAAFHIRRDRAHGSGSRTVFRPSFHSFLFGGKIDVRFEAQTARMTGPKVCLESLWRNLRLAQQVEEVHRRRDSSCHLPKVDVVSGANHK
jgi:hypothetical protein